MITTQEAKAGLGLATKLQEMLMMPKAQTQDQPQTPEAPQTPNSAPEPPTNQETGADLKAEMQGLEGRIFDELGTLKQEIQKVSGQDSQKVLEDLKKQIDSALNSND